MQTTAQFFQMRSGHVQRKLDTIYDMLQTDRMPKEMLDLVMKLQRRAENEYNELAYHADQKAQQ
jgi:hypothetical protein